MLPEAEDTPASLPQFAVRGSVSLLVSLQLLPPVLPIALGDVAVLGAVVPEAAVNEDG